MFQKKSESIRDLIKFYENVYTKDTKTSLYRHNSMYSYSSYNLDYRKNEEPTNICSVNNKSNLNDNKPLSSFTNLDKSLSTTSSYSSKSSSSLSLNNDENENYTLAKENYPQQKPMTPQPTTNSFLIKRKSSSFYVAKQTAVKTEQNGGGPKVLQRTNSNSLSSNVKKFDPRSIQKIVLEWCQNRTKNYQNVNITNFSSSWADGLAFCALIHSYMPEAFDFNKLSSQNRRYNFQLAFDVAYKKANIMPLLEVSDMISMGNRPDDRCIYTYLSTIYSRFNNPRNKLHNLEEIKEHVK